MRNALPIILTAALLTPAAQSSQGPGSQGTGSQAAGNGPSPQMQAQLRKYQPVFDLTTTVSLMPQLDGDKKTQLSAAQAKQLLPVLQDLSKRSDLTPADARKILDNIEDKVLTDAQVTRLDDLVLARQEERRARQAQAPGGQQGGTGARLPFLPGGGFGGANRPTGTGSARSGGPGGMFQAIQSGEPFNPFKEGRASEQLQALLKILQKK